MMKNSRWPNTSKKHDMQYWGWWWYYSSSSWGLEFGNQFGIAHQLSHGAKLNNAHDSRVYWKTRSHGVVLLWCRPVVSNDFIHTLLNICMRFRNCRILVWAVLLDCRFAHATHLRMNSRRRIWFLHYFVVRIFSQQYLRWRPKRKSTKSTYKATRSINSIIGRHRLFVFGRVKK